MTLELTIALPVKNEETDLLACLNAIGHDFAKRVVVIDSGSSDATPSIAKEWGADVVDFAWNGQFPKKRNWFLRNHRPETKWVLFLDADEHLTSAFKEELRATLPETEHVGFWLHYTIYFLGRELKHGYPLDKLALFQVGSGEYEKIDEEGWSKLDMEIHEHPILDGSIGTIRTKIDHRDFRPVHHYIAKHNEYSSWEAKRYLAREVGSLEAMTLKQKIKYRLVNSPMAGPVYFLGAYVLMRGFLDGSRGFAFALLKLSYFTQVYCKIQELKRIPSQSHKQNT
ncbi:glycosyltransferase family 2 protein [Rhodopirellula sallentina]|uniref:Glycosyl transferase, group 2 family protein n=1 Tax=Rhodopirellula sallentina SM41 TaxID=1263870 RepID=M5TV96_9BACT|nr:glycosyltransferase family 2 protein [Rhodopirellula sallentina]EMI53117.1 glycosyl transferase, group 2 family protein [Rhodopirellula sallentina SM41]